VAEIVPVVAARSARYTRAQDTLGLLAAILGFSSVALVSDDHAVLWWEGLLAIVVGAALGSAVIGRFEPVVRWVAGPADMQLRTEAQALRHFRTFGVGATESRAGVLIYLSLFEHMVVVLEDPRVASALPPDSSAKIRDAVIARMREGKPVEALCDAIAEAGRMLGEAFPRQPDDQNELSDSLRIVD
jgi:putative membrane protein